MDNVEKQNIFSRLTAERDMKVQFSRVLPDLKASEASKNVDT
jgi:hypothetical protein